jgi:hypothetical protein
MLEVESTFGVTVELRHIARILIKERGCEENTNAWIVLMTRYWWTSNAYLT